MRRLRTVLVVLILLVIGLVILDRPRGGPAVPAAAAAPVPVSAQEHLDARVPLSVAQWHLHVNICLPAPRDRGHADWTRFGFAGAITTQAACDAAGGQFHSQFFGWMVHVHPFETDPAAIWTH